MKVKSHSKPPTSVKRPIQCYWSLIHFKSIFPAGLMCNVGEWRNFTEGMQEFLSLIFSVIIWALIYVCKTERGAHWAKIRRMRPD